MVEKRHILVLYTTAVCNLKCVYCYIDKNPILAEIDNILDESFKGDYYYNFTRKMFPDINQLEEVEFWGGEPLLRLDRAYYTVNRLVETYPRLNRFMMSTNFTNSNWFDQFYGLTDILGKYSNRKFTINLQLSLDGPTDITDRNRGKGVTKAFTEHFIELVKTMDDRVPKNVEIRAHFKPTLTAEIIHKLQDKESIIRYFKFFELFYREWLKVKDRDRLSISYNLPNTACPSPHTKEDGILFANYCRLCSEISKEQRKTGSIFRFYRDIVSFRPRYKINYNNSYCGNCGNCGTGYSVIGLLPYDMISACHSGFTDILGEYKKHAMELEGKEHAIEFKLFLNDSSMMIHTVDSFKIYEKLSEEFYRKDTKFKITNIATMIRLLACTGQVDKKYTDTKEALAGAKFIEASTSYCMRDNLGSTGSTVLVPVGLLKLLLNGAREFIEND